MIALVQSLKEFNKLSAIPFGISSNSIEQHSEFAKNHNLSINLLADPDNNVIKTYTGTSKIGTVSSRQSFLKYAVLEQYKIEEGEFNASIFFILFSNLFFSHISS